VPKSSGREELSVLIGLEVLTEGIAFDTSDLKKHRFSSTLVTKVLRSLRQSGVLERVNARRYLFAEGFSGVLKEDILRKTPRSGLMQFPTMAVFDICGIEGWTERDLESFVRRLREHWKEKHT
jgi:hypothetical protein